MFRFTPPTLYPVRNASPTSRAGLKILEKRNFLPLREIELEFLGFPTRNLIDRKYDKTELEFLGFPARNLIDRKYDKIELEFLGFPTRNLIYRKYDKIELEFLGFPTRNLIYRKYDKIELEFLGFPTRHLVDRKYDKQNWRAKSSNRLSPNKCWKQTWCHCKTAHPTPCVLIGRLIYSAILVVTRWRQTAGAGI